MLMQSDFEAALVATITDPEILERYNAQDPLVIQQIRSLAAYFSLMAQEIDIATLEPFNKTRDRSIIADATNKGILPIATACQHVLEVINRSTASITLSQGRMIEDNSGGRPWRLLQSVSVPAGATGQVLVEQSEYREIAYTVPTTEPFHRFKVDLKDDLSLANINIRDTATPANQYQLKIRWMNAAALDYAVNVTADSLRRLFVEFGSDDRAGRTAQANQVFIIGLLETYGEVDVSRLRDASLLDVHSSDEQRVSVRFKAGGLVRQGADPLSVAQLRLLASYPALYDENAVFLENFDYLVRQKFMNRTHFISVWNENVQERHYGVTWQDINHLNLAVVAKNPAEQASIQQEIMQLIGRADSLYQNRVNIRAVFEKPCQVTITGRLAAVHDLDTVKEQIKNLLVDRYGRTTIVASRWLVNGFNSQEMATLLRNNIVAFQDRISDFAINVQAGTNKPHEWVYITASSITVNLERTADSVSAPWIL